MTHRTNAADPRRDRLRILAALYADQPPPGATPEVLSEWARLQVDRGRTDHDVAARLGWTIDEVRQAVAERARR